MAEKRRIRVIATALVVAGVLAGCAPSQSGASPTPTSTGEPTSTATRTPAAVQDPEDPTSWVVDAGGVGPIRIGGNLAETLAELPASWQNDPESCAWMASWTADDSSYGLFFVRGTESEKAPIAEISVYTAAETPSTLHSPTTPEGLGIGATKQEVLAAYPDAEEGTAQIGGGSWIRLAETAEAHVFFEFREGMDVASDIVVTTRSEPSYEVCG